MFLCSILLAGMFVAGFLRLFWKEETDGMALIFLSVFGSFILLIIEASARKGGC